VAAESIVLDYVKSPGAKSMARFSELRNELQSAISKLQRRVSRSR
jgi:hypothetical protein